MPVVEYKKPMHPDQAKFIRASIINYVPKIIVLNVFFLVWAVMLPSLRHLAALALWVAVGAVYIWIGQRSCLNVLDVGGPEVPTPGRAFLLAVIHVLVVLAYWGIAPTLSSALG